MTPLWGRLGLAGALVLLSASLPAFVSCTSASETPGDGNAAAEPRVHGAAAPSDPDFIILLGDVQPGWQCRRWGEAHDDVGDQACGHAQVRRADEVLRRAWARYPSTGTVILLGDLVDGWQGGGAAWESRLMGQWFGSLPEEIKEVTEWVLGNHDAQSSGCNDLARSMHDPFQQSQHQSPPLHTKLTWSRKLKHTHVFGIHSALLTHTTAVACHAQDDPGKYTWQPFAPAVCFGDESRNAAGTKAYDERCSDDAECRSGQCGIWERYYEAQMAHAERSIAACLQDPEASACLMASHFALCRQGNPDCPNDASSAWDRFSKIQNLLQCSDDGRYCTEGYTDGARALTRCAGAGATCDVERAGFESRDRLVTAVRSIGDSKSFVQASGHVGGSEPRPPAGEEILGVSFVTAEVPGPGTTGWTRSNAHALVIRVDESGARIVERLLAENRAPVLHPLGELWAASGSQDFTIRGSDPDYGDLNYVLSGEVPPCMRLNQGTNIHAGGDLTATLELRSCPPGSYTGLTITITDGHLAGARNEGPGTPWYGGTLHPGSIHSLQASETFRVTVADGR